MDLAIKYTENTNTKDFSTGNLNSTKLHNVVLLKVAGKNAKNKNRSSKISIIDVINQMIFGFREIKNTLPTGIEGMQVSNFHALSHSLSDVIVSRHDVDFKNRLDCDIVVMHGDSFDEYFYIPRKDIVEKKEFSNENERIENAFGIGVTYSKLLIGLDLMCKTYYPNYSISVTDKKLTVVYKGNVLNSIDEIKDDEVFTLFLFAQVLLDRTKKFVNIIFADGSSMSSMMLSAMEFLLTVLLGQNYTLVLYNLDNYQERTFLKQWKNTQVIELPDHKNNETMNAISSELTKKTSGRNT